jgi:hypothetical protein
MTRLPCYTLNQHDRILAHSAQQYPEFGSPGGYFSADLAGNDF